MPDFLEKALRHSAKKNGVKDEDAYVYGTMNKLGAMHGNKETAKGAEMQAKHEADMKSGKKSAKRRTKKRKGGVFF